MKPADHYVYITGTSLECYRDLRGGLSPVANLAIPRQVAIDQESLDRSVREFEAHLDLYALDRYYVITDTQAEAYQAETVPTLSGRDLRLLLTRKLEQRYRTTVYRGVVPHRARPYAFFRNLVRRRPRQTTRILYALIGPEALAPWLSALENRELDVRGLYSLGTLMPALIADLKLPPRSDALLVMRTAAGYRHAFVAPSGLRFSRLCAYSTAGDVQVGQEIDKTLQYLTMTRLWGVEGRHRTLHIAVIDAQPASAQLSVPGNNLRTAQLVQLRPRDLTDGPEASLEAPNSAWLLFNRAALRQHGTGCAAGLSLLQASRRATQRRAALYATAAVAAASVGYLAVGASGIRENLGLAATDELVADHLNAAAEMSERSAPKTELDPEQLRAVVQARDRLLARNIDAGGLLQRTAAALAPFPSLTIDTLEWAYADAAAPAGMSGSAAPPGPAPAGSPGSNTIVLHLGGHVAGEILKSDANAAVGGLAAALARELHGHPVIERLPFDVAPGGTLESKREEHDGKKSEFSVSVSVTADPS
jgi:hypothetical protein